jgi:type III secretion system FlhB-like substrate exporter
MSETIPPKVVGIRYDGADSVPVVVLKGAGEHARSLVDQARASEAVPVVRDVALADALYRIPVDAPIDRALFPVMAAVLIHVMKIDQEQPSNE